MKRQELVAGLDIGSSSIKFTVYDLRGKTVFDQSIQYPTHYPNLGWAEQSPLDWKKTILALFVAYAQKLNTSSDHIAALGLSVHAPSIIFVDGNGESIFDFAPIWCDERSAEQAKKLIKEVGPGFAGLGLPLASFPAKLMWFSEKYPNLLNQAQYALGIKGFIVRWLVGDWATEPSSEPGNESCWVDIIQTCGWVVSKLPPVYPSSYIIGNLRDEICQETGLPTGIPVVLGMNDGGSSTLSCGAYQPGEAVIELATNGVIYLVSDKPSDPEWSLKHALFRWKYLDGLWMVGGQTKCGASSFDWSARLFNGQQSAKVDQWIEAANRAPRGSNGLVFLPYLHGRGTPDDNPTIRASFFGLDMSTSPAGLSRSVIEGVAFALREVLEELRKTALPINHLLIAGGGAQSAFVRQVISDVIGAPLRWTNSRATLGAAMYGAVGKGLFHDISEAVNFMNSPNLDVYPDPEASKDYEALFQRFMDIRDRVIGLSDRNTLEQ